MSIANLKVSILVNCYNSEAFLKEALDSIYRQTHQNFEIILVDNCSVDRTAEIAHSYDSKLKYVKTEKNCPLYAARNVGLKHVSGEFLCILDSDDFWVEDKLELQLKKMVESSQVDILYTAYNSYYEASESFINSIKRLYLIFINFSDNFIFSGFVSSSKILKNYNINFQTIMFKTSSIQNVLFDDSMSLTGDLDYIYRLIWINKLNLYYLNNLTAYSRIHPKQLSRRSDLRWVIESYRVYYKIEKYMSTDERRLFKKYFIIFYYSSYLLRVKKVKQALLIKFSYIFGSLRFSLHFFKSLLVYLKGI